MQLQLQLRVRVRVRVLAPVPCGSHFLASLDMRNTQQQCRHGASTSTSLIAGSKNRSNSSAARAMPPLMPAMGPAASIDTAWCANRSMRRCVWTLGRAGLTAKLDLRRRDAVSNATTPHGANTDRSQLKGRGKPPRRGDQGWTLDAVPSGLRTMSQILNPHPRPSQWSPQTFPTKQPMLAAGDTHHSPSCSPSHSSTSVLKRSFHHPLPYVHRDPPREATVQIISKYHRCSQYYPGYYQTQPLIIPSPDEAPASWYMPIVASMC